MKKIAEMRSQSESYKRNMKAFRQGLGGLSTKLEAFESSLLDTQDRFQKITANKSLLSQPYIF